MGPTQFDDYVKLELGANASIVSNAGIKPN